MVSFAAATWVVVQHFSLLNSCFNLNHISLCSLTNDGYAHIILSKSQTLNKQKLWCTPDIKIKQSFAQIKHVRSENLCPKKFYKYNRHSSSRIEANNNCQTATVNFLLIGVKLAAVKTEGKECGSGVSSRFWGEALRDNPSNSCEGGYGDVTSDLSCMSCEICRVLVYINPLSPMVSLIFSLMAFIH